MMNEWWLIKIKTKRTSSHPSGYTYHANSSLLFVISPFLFVSFTITSLQKKELQEMWLAVPPPAGGLETCRDTVQPWALPWLIIPCWSQSWSCSGLHVPNRDSSMEYGWIPLGNVTIWVLWSSRPESYMSLTHSCSTWCVGAQSWGAVASPVALTASNIRITAQPKLHLQGAWWGLCPNSASCPGCHVLAGAHHDLPSLSRVPVGRQAWGKARRNNRGSLKWGKCLIALN